MTNALTNSMASSGSASPSIMCFDCSADNFIRKSGSFNYFFKDFVIQSNELTINLVNPEIIAMGASEKTSPFKYQLKCYDADDNELAANAYITFVGSQDMNTGNTTLKLSDGLASAKLPTHITPHLTGSAVKVHVDFSGTNVVTTVIKGDTDAVLCTVTGLAISAPVAKLKLTVMLDISSDWISSNSVFNIDLLNSSIEAPSLANKIGLVLGNSL
jgi:hypothetical protein